MPRWAGANEVAASRPPRDRGCLIRGLVRSPRPARLPCPPIGGFRSRLPSNLPLRPVSPLRRSLSLCSTCDRGQRHCGVCGPIARRERKRQANQRYQRSFKGLRAAAARQARLRHRRRLELRVTDPGSQRPPSDPTFPVPAAPAGSPRGLGGRPCRRGTRTCAWAPGTTPGSWSPDRTGTCSRPACPGPSTLGFGKTPSTIRRVRCCRFVTRSAHVTSDKAHTTPRSARVRR